jgi:hypothetical protein
LTIVKFSNKNKNILNFIVTAANDGIQQEVQIYANNFQMNSQWIGSVPMIAFSIIAGALSDVFGRKPLLLYPLIQGFSNFFVSRPFQNAFKIMRP